MELLKLRFNAKEIIISHVKFTMFSKAILFIYLSYNTNLVNDCSSAKIKIKD